MVLLLTTLLCVTFDTTRLLGIFEWGLGVICFHLEKPSLWQHRGGFFMCYNVKKFQFQENINGYSDI